MPSLRPRPLSSKQAQSEFGRKGHGDNSIRSTERTTRKESEEYPRWAGLAQVDTIR